MDSPSNQCTLDDNGHLKDAEDIDFHESESAQTVICHIQDIGTVNCSITCKELNDSNQSHLATNTVIHRHSHWKKSQQLQESITADRLDEFRNLEKKYCIPYHMDDGLQTSHPIAVSH